ncbi:MAG: ATP-binding protein [Chromatiales bacterium]|jgi:signal transduction histidine kinase|nr:ATP-binding protein [Chromatiales bacterium]MDX9767011.1 ATP-binding protein [Ectothiorhodospiraceae bacterium]
MRSIAGKITLGYYLLAAVVLAVVAVTVLELHGLERKVTAGERVARFLNATLEVRRFEKNYLLYGEPTELEEGLAYLAEARGLLAAHGADFLAVTTPAALATLRQDLASYDAMVQAAADTLPLPEPRAETLRAVGKRIVTAAERMAADERRLLQHALTRSRGFLLVAVLLLVGVGVLLGSALSQRVVRPLKELESSMTAVAAGARGPIHLHADDREIRSLQDAFNRMLAELAAQQGHLVRSQKLAALGTLLSGVAHELNNPLSNISTSIQILIEELDETDRERLRETLVLVDEQTERARHIVRTLLEFARERGFRRERLAVHGLIDDTLRFLRGEIPRGVALVVDVPQGLAVLGDKPRLQQALLNLIKNAAEAAGHGGTITVRALHPAREGRDVARCQDIQRCVDIEVGDSGPGIAPDILPRLFDPFFTTKAVGKGSGLGLAIVHEIAEEHDGCVGVESAPGRGTTFFLRLPVAIESGDVA